MSERRGRMEDGGLKEIKEDGVGEWEWGGGVTGGRALIQSNVSD